MSEFTEFPEGHKTNIANGGQRTFADRETPMPGEGHLGCAEGRVGFAFPWQPAIDEIRANHRTRSFAMEQRKRCDLALGSYLRSVLGWRLDLEADERKAIAAHAASLIKAGEKEAKGKPHDDVEGFAVHRDVIMAAIHSRAPWDAVEKASTDCMAKTAESLPIWETFGEPIRGFGPVSLAVIIGEAGDVGSYSSHSKLWKRMGLAVFDGVRQGGLLKSASKDEWIEHGYNRQRRSRMFVIGDALIKSNGDGRYRTAYLARKEYERARAMAEGKQVIPAAKIPKNKDKAKLFMSDGHVHARAQRYMEKRLLRDLWKAWRA